ncbi:MAG: hypothetical protein H6618_00255 [Deltaproteobacteria bacterium]|nr:hypothetical protein [Deltaproteobacteria bacterium]
MINETIKSFFDKYSSEFKSESNETLLKCFDFPVMICHAGKSSVFTDSKQLNTGLTALKKIYRSMDLEEYSYKIANFSRLAEAHCLVGVEWTFKDSKGHVKSHFLSHYNLIERNNHLHIQMVVNPDEKF